MGTGTRSCFSYVGYRTAAEPTLAAARKYFLRCRPPEKCLAACGLGRRAYPKLGAQGPLQRGAGTPGNSWKGTVAGSRAEASVGAGSYVSARAPTSPSTARTPGRNRHERV